MSEYHSTVTTTSVSRQLSFFTIELFITMCGKFSDKELADLLIKFALQTKDSAMIRFFSSLRQTEVAIYCIKSQFCWNFVCNLCAANAKSDLLDYVIEKYYQ